MGRRRSRCTIGTSEEWSGTTVEGAPGRGGGCPSAGRGVPPGGEGWTWGPGAKECRRGIIARHGVRVTHSFADARIALAKGFGVVFCLRMVALPTAAVSAAALEPTPGAPRRCAAHYGAMGAQTGRARRAPLATVGEECRFETICQHVPDLRARKRQELLPYGQFRTADGHGWRH